MIRIINKIFLHQFQGITRFRESPIVQYYIMSTTVSGLVVTGAAGITVNNGATTVRNNTGTTLAVTGTSSYSDVVSINGGATIIQGNASYALQVAGPCVLGNGFIVTGATVMTGTATLGNRLTINQGGLRVAALNGSTLLEGAVAMNQRLSVSGAATFRDALSVSGPLTVSGAATFRDSLTVTKDLTATTGNIVADNGGLLIKDTNHNILIGTGTLPTVTGSYNVVITP